MGNAQMFGLFHSCCKAVLDKCPNEYAKAYADAGLRLEDPHAVRVQCLYILNNMSHWRGDEAKRVRADLKLLSHE